MKNVNSAPQVLRNFCANQTGCSLTLDEWQRFVREDAQTWRPLVLQSGVMID
jgi:hypothetical protein